MLYTIILIFKCLQGNLNSLNVTSLNGDNHVLNSATNENSNVINDCANYDNDDNDDDEEEGDAVDMDAFVESGLLEDDSVSLFHTYLLKFSYLIIEEQG